jgi:hypothetical protein
MAKGSFVRALSTSSPIFANVTVSASFYVTDRSPTFSPTIPPLSATPNSPYTEMAIQARVSSLVVSNPIAIIYYPHNSLHSGVYVLILLLLLWH